MSASSTAKTYLFYASELVAPYTSLAKLVDITSYPDTGSSPNKLDTTTLSAERLKTNILGLQEAPELTFECNYDKTAFSTISALDGTYHFQLQFDDAGVGGKFDWNGEISVFATGGGVDEVRKMTVTISATDELVFS